MEPSTIREAVRKIKHTWPHPNVHSDVEQELLALARLDAHPCLEVADDHGWILSTTVGGMSLETSACETPYFALVYFSHMLDEIKPNLLHYHQLYITNQATFYEKLDRAVLSVMTQVQKEIDCDE